jgi:hypothetical protein
MICEEKKSQGEDVRHQEKSAVITSQKKLNLNTNNNGKDM